MSALNIRIRPRHNASGLKWCLGQNVSLEARNEAKYVASKPRARLMLNVWPGGRGQKVEAETEASVTSLRPKCWPRW